MVWAGAVQGLRETWDRCVPGMGQCRGTAARAVQQVSFCKTGHMVTQWEAGVQDGVDRGWSRKFRTARRMAHMMRASCRTERVVGKIGPHLRCGCVAGSSCRLSGEKHSRPSVEPRVYALLLSLLWLPSIAVAMLNSNLPMGMA